MPGFYQVGSTTSRGRSCAWWTKRCYDGSKIKKGDRAYRPRSNGLHTNGYSLARKIVTEAARKSYSDIFPETGRTSARSFYGPIGHTGPVLTLMKKGLIRGCAHITGAGLRQCGPHPSAEVRRGDRLRCRGRRTRSLPGCRSTAAWKTSKCIERQHGDRHGARGKTDDAKSASAIEIAGKIQASVIGTVVAGSGKVRLGFSCSWLLDDNLLSFGSLDHLPAAFGSRWLTCGYHMEKNCICITPRRARRNFRALTRGSGGCTAAARRFTITRTSELAVVHF